MGFILSYFKQTSRFILLALILINVTPAFAKQTILVWGDSLSAAYGIPVEKGWVNLMRKKLGEEFDIVNGSISGETTKGGLTRLPAALTMHQPNLIIIELGANDGLRGLPPVVTKNNLNKMIQQAKKNNIEIVLLGMKIPPNYGKAYANQFEKLFSDLAEEHKLPFIPFFLEEIIQDLKLLQEDELHPTVEAQPILLKKILPVIQTQIKKPT